MNTNTNSDKSTSMNKRTMIMVRINEQAEQFYAKSQTLGTLAAKSFHEVRGAEKARHRAQMTGLENIAETTLKVSDVLDYIKKQIARQQGWTRQIDGQSFGESLKSYIEGDLKTAVNRVCVSVGIGNESEQDTRERQKIYLDLVRQLIRQIVVQYEYIIAKEEGSPR